MNEGGLSYHSTEGDSNAEVCRRAGASAAYNDVAWPDGGGAALHVGGCATST